ncbi:MAG: sensor histidine kinase [Pyrinomonadaceae bacterium]
MDLRVLERKWVGYVVAAFSIAVLTAVLKLLGGHVNATTVALALLLDVLFIATRWGSLPALAASVLAMLCFNFFFLPPFGTFTIAARDNWIALAAFLITAITAGQLSARAKRRAEEAEERGREAEERGHQIERLYAELRDAFERASHAEALKQSERLKSALLDAVTHDLRTPLTSIIASVSILLEDRCEDPERPEEKEQRALLKVIDQEANRLDRFVEGLVDLAQIEAGEITVPRNWGAVDEIIEAALTRAESLTDQHNVEVVIEDELPSVRVNARAIAEVVYTLVDNASKYSPHRTRISVEASRTLDEMVQITVEDEGHGVPEELRDRVFDKFFRATSGVEVRANRPRGIGMGLAIARGIVEAHGGRIWIESGRRSVGTRVLFTVPIGDEEQSEAEEPSVLSTVTPRRIKAASSALKIQ